MRFDWYAATIQEHPIELVQSLREDLGGEAKPTRGMHGYSQGWEIADTQGRTLARVLAGGRNGDPHAWASGEATQGFCEVVRGRWPDRHHVTRLDAAQDYAAPGSYERLREVVRRVARDNRVKGREIVPEDLADGRTFYGGAPSSDVRARLYEKGKQMRGQLIGGVPDGLMLVIDGQEYPFEDWTRLEVQVRPQRQAKKTAAYVTPEMGWAFASWTSAVAQEVMGLDLERIDGRCWQEPDDERSLRYLVRQYGNLLRRMKAEAGSWRAVGATLGELVDKA